MSREVKSAEDGEQVSSYNVSTQGTIMSLCLIVNTFWHKTSFKRVLRLRSSLAVI